MSEWENFLMAEAGASAVLAGLIFVGLSINLGKILTIPKMPNRARESLALLITILVVTSLLLVPGQPLLLVAIELLVIGSGLWIFVLISDISMWKQVQEPFRRRIPLLMLMNQLSTIPYIIAGITLIFAGLSGLYWLVPAFIISFIKATMDAWVLLVEINR